MATITLYAGKVNQMPSLINDAKKSVKEYKDDLNSLKLKLFTIDSSVCNVDDVISSIKSSTQTQEDKIESLESLNENINEYISDVVTIDQNAADAINQSKNDFYEKYEYLKPDIERNESGWTKFWKSVGEWCKEHWKEMVAIVVTIVIAVGIICVSVATFGGAAVALAALVGGILSTVGQLASNIVTYAITGKWQGSILDYLGAFVGGAVGGILMINPAGASCSAIIGSIFGKAGVALAVDAFVSTSLTENFKNIFGIENKSFTKISLDICGSVVFAFVLGKVFEGPTKAIAQKMANKFSGIQAFERLVGTHSYSADFARQITRAANKQVPFKFDIFSRYFKTLRNGLVGGYVEGFFENIGQGGIDAITE